MIISEEMLYRIEHEVPLEDLMEITGLEIRDFIEKFEDVILDNIDEVREYMGDYE